MSKKKNKLRNKNEPTTSAGLDLFMSAKGLSEDQKKVFKSVITEECNHYIGGNPGTGKSYLLNCLKLYLKNALTITSTTGISAINVKGVTLHSFMGIFHMNMDFDTLVNSIIKKSKSKFRKLNYLVIEECSMCDALLFSLLEYCLRVARNNPKPFGGVKIILIGDFMQLPPVNDYGFLFQSDAYKTGNFKVHLLTQSHRQSDPKFYSILQECRMGKLSKESFETLKSREIQNVSEDMLRMYSTNEEVKQWNDYKYNQIDAPEQVYYAEDKSISDKFITLFDKNSLIEKTLRLKPSTRVMLLRNLDFQHELINGSQGRVLSCQKHYVTVEFDNGQIRDIYPVDNEYMIDGTIVANRVQIPLRQSYSCSIHKTQSLTLDQAFIDCKRVFAPGQVYVAISRLKTLDGVFLSNLNENSFKVDPVAMNFYAEVQDMFEKEKEEIKLKQEEYAATLANKNTKNTLKNSKTPKSNRELFESKYFKNKRR